MNEKSIDNSSTFQFGLERQWDEHCQSHWEIGRRLETGLYFKSEHRRLDIEKMFAGIMEILFL